MTTLEALRASVFMGELEAHLRLAISEGPTELGQRQCREGARMVDSEAFDGLPEDSQDNLLTLYSQALFRATGGLA